jgi:hypothetical protein
MLALAFTALAFASGGESINATVCERETFWTRPVSAKVKRLRVFANGGELSGSRNGRDYAEWYGRGVAVSLLARGPGKRMRWRVANVRDSCSKVRLVYTLA